MFSSTCCYVYCPRIDVHSLVVGKKSFFSTSASIWHKNSSSRSHYDTLNLPANASKSDIKSSYYDLSKKFHPDINKSPDSGERFKEITDAYKVLGNDKAKLEYDRLNLRPFTDPMRPRSPFRKQSEAHRQWRDNNNHKSWQEMNDFWTSEEKRWMNMNNKKTRRQGPWSQWSEDHERKYQRYSEWMKRNDPTCYNKNQEDPQNPKMSMTGPSYVKRLFLNFLIVYLWMSVFLTILREKEKVDYDVPIARTTKKRESDETSHK